MWIVSGTYGAYSDTVTWVVGASTSLVDAAALLQVCNAWRQKTLEGLEDDVPYGEDLTFPPGPDKMWQGENTPRALWDTTYSLERVEDAAVLLKALRVGQAGGKGRRGSRS